MNSRVQLTIVSVMAVVVVAVGGPAGTVQHGWGMLAGETAAPPADRSPAAGSESPLVLDWPEVDQLPVQEGLPDPRTRLDGTMVTDPTDWPEHREYLKAMFAHYMYGTMPPKPESVAQETVGVRAAENGRARIEDWKVTVRRNDEEFSVRAALLRPDRPGRFPVIIKNDRFLFGEERLTGREAAWVADRPAVFEHQQFANQQAVERGYVLFKFMREDVAVDAPNARDRGVFPLFPEYPEWGIIAAWAWAYQFLIDTLVAQPFVHAEQIVVTGHSRGGKAALCAGIYDDRIAITAPNSSGSGGTGGWRFFDPQQRAQTLRVHAERASHRVWWTPRLMDFVGRVERLPFEAHTLKAAIAPRAFLNTHARHDWWANPYGTARNHQAALPVFQWLGAADRAALHWRDGGHAQAQEDWAALFDFCDRVLRGDLHIHTPHSDGSMTTEASVERFAVMSPEERLAYERRFSADLLRRIVDQEVEDWHADVLRPMADLALIPPRIHADPGPEYGYEHLDYAMNLGTERTPGGRLWAAWVAGEDGPKGFIVAAISDDNGETWSEHPRLVIDSHSPDLPYPRTNWGGNLWADPNGRLWFFFTQVMNARDGRHGVWATSCDNADADSPEWSEPRWLWHGGALNKPIVLSTGEWVLPLYLLESAYSMGRGNPPFRDLFPELERHRGAHAFVSEDQGKTWASRGQVRFPNPQFPEHMLVERKDGALWMLARTQPPDRSRSIMQSLSWDAGRTWSEPRHLDGVAHPVSRFHIRRLASGNILLVKHGPEIDEVRGDWGRNDLTAWLSGDEGETWQGGLMLDERSGVSYPDGFQAPDRTVYITYDRRRGGHDGDPGEILMARFTEADVLAGEIVNPDSKLKMLVHRANPDTWDGR